MIKIVRIFLFGVSAFVISCGTNTDRQQDINGKYYDYAYLIPDSLRTPEQQELMDTLCKLIADGIYIENNQWRFKYTKEDFDKNGIPQVYYDVFMQNVNDINKGIKEWGLNSQDIKEMTNDMRQKINEMLSKRSDN